MERFEIVEESNSDFLLKIKLPHYHYIDEFIRLKCAPTLLNQDIFPNIKEISESMAAYNAIRRYLGVKTFGEPWSLFDIACGHSPRTAALFAHMTRWDCHAIDPVLKKKPKFLQNRRLVLWSCKLEELPEFAVDTAIVTAIHAHVKLDKILKKISAQRIIVIAMPCCRPLFFTDHKPVFEFEDLGCLSPKRVVKIYDIIHEN